MVIREVHNGKRNWQHAYSIMGLMDCMIFVLILASFGMSYEIDANDEALYNDNKFFDVEFYSYNYKICMILNAAVILLVMMRLIVCFRLSRSVHIHLFTIELASKNVMAFMLIFLPIIIGFVILCLNIYGTTLENFRNFEQALLYLVLLTSGYGDILTMLLQHRAETVILWVLYFFGVLFFLTSVFMGIYMDAYRRTKMLCGKDDKNCVGADRAMLKDWVMNSLPAFVGRWKCFKKAEKNESEDDE